VPELVGAVETVRARGCVIVIATFEAAQINKLIARIDALEAARP
jgi:hypothetical protein